MAKDTHYSKQFIMENKIFKLHIIARGIILDGSKLLVCKNNTNTFLPGGHLEFDEDLRSTLKREIFEELGFECVVENILVAWKVFGKKKTYIIKK